MPRSRPGRHPLAALLLVMVTAATARPLAAQVPTSAQSVDTALIRRALQSDSLTRDTLLQGQIRDAIQQSGLSQEELRAQLRANGYNSSLLDSYFNAGAAQQNRVANSRFELDAVRRLGLLPDSVADSLLARFDTTRMDTTKLAVPDSVRRIFGLEIFAGSQAQFRPTMGGPVPDNYRLGPGDQLALILTGDVEQAYSLEVSRDGFVVIPSVGTLYVANLTMAQLRDALYTRLGRVYSGVRRGAGATTRFEVTVARMRNIQVFVAGAVQHPGTYDIAASSTPLTALFAASGPRIEGSLRHLEVRRHGVLVDSMDVYDFLLNGIDRTSEPLQTGDVIFVPTHGGRVAVAGAVVRPAIYEIRPGETLADILRFAGGFRADALRRRIQIHRILPPSDADSLYGRGRIVVDVGPEQLARTVPGLPMLPGDSVTAFSVPDRLRGFVTVNGNVWVPGPVGYSPTLTLGDAVRLAGGPKPDVYLDQILISRLRSDSTRIQLRSSFADSTGRVTSDLRLQEDDEITVFSRTTFRPERYVIVSGAVRSPGRLPYREGMTVRDAILLADGLAEDAYLNEAEIARVPDSRTAGQVSRTIRVPLDSTYLFARGNPGEYPGPPGVAAPASGAPEVALQPYDNLLILRQPEWELPRTVKITGQVKYPGPYALRTKTDRLADLITRAGGLTPEAYPQGISFVRMQDSVGRVGIDLPRVLKDTTNRDNIILAAGDSINIPEYDPVVLVTGAVNAPGAVAFRPGADIDYYVRAAGGYTFSGDKGRIWVEQPNGQKEAVIRRFLLPDTKPEPRPGSEVTVPERNPKQQGTPVTGIIGAAAQVLASIVTIIVVAKK